MYRLFLMGRDQLRITLGRHTPLSSCSREKQFPHTSHELQTETLSSEKLFLDILSPCGLLGPKLCNTQHDSTTMLKIFPHPQIPFPHCPPPPTRVAYKEQGRWLHTQKGAVSSECPVPFLLTLKPTLLVCSAS